MSAALRRGPRVRAGRGREGSLARHGARAGYRRGGAGLRAAQGPRCVLCVRCVCRVRACVRACVRSRGVDSRALRYISRRACKLLLLPPAPCSRLFTSKGVPSVGSRVEMSPHASTLPRFHASAPRSSPLFLSRVRDVSWHRGMARSASSVSRHSPSHSVFPSIHNPN
jgi:hypothetical protein